MIARPDGRRLAYRELGDPRGPPLRSCHGFLSSRSEARLLHTLGRKLGIRILARNRPG